jgi:hypothetical protein
MSMCQGWPEMGNPSRSLFLAGSRLTCTHDKLSAMLAWRGTFLDTLRPAVFSAPYNGAFITSCLVHEQNVDYCNTQSVPNCRGWNKYNITAPGYAPQLSPQRGFSVWYDSLQSSWEEVVKVRAAWAVRVAESAARGPLAHHLTTLPPPKATSPLSLAVASRDVRAATRARRKAATVACILARSTPGLCSRVARYMPISVAPRPRPRAANVKVRTRSYTGVSSFRGIA